MKIRWEFIIPWMLVTVFCAVVWIATWHGFASLLQAIWGPGV